MLFGLIDAADLENGGVAAALPTAASLVCVFDEPSKTHGIEENPQSASRSNLPEMMKQ